MILNYICQAECEKVASFRIGVKSGSQLSGIAGFFEVQIAGAPAAAASQVTDYECVRRNAETCVLHLYFFTG